MHMARRLVIAPILIVALGIGLGVGAMVYFNVWKTNEIVPDDEVIFVVEPGESFQHIAANLESTGLIKRRRMFHILGLLEGQLASIQAGEYSFAQAATPVSVLRKLTSGDVVKRQVRLPEGGTFRQFKKVLQSEDKLNFDIESVSVRNVFEFLGVTGEDKIFGEGWFFPDTYFFQMGEKASDVLMVAHQRMVEALDESWKARTANGVLSNRYDLLILASLIEKETSRKEDKALISGVFSRRLAKEMKLQADPTVIYGLGEEFDGDLKREHLRTPNDYNTYVNLGLPPTPISAPSSDSLHAAANPATGDALFFVGRGDGTTHFSSTLKEHNEAVERFQLGKGD
ncbi:MAG: endolytic transglycosylase MltG [Gammaproteobacteria bacterium]|nr:endolytic transglycosylase MltG [Gammaproteobacteria bacterium]